MFEPTHFYPDFQGEKERYENISTEGFVFYFRGLTLGAINEAKYNEARMKLAKTLGIFVCFAFIPLFFYAPLAFSDVAILAILGEFLFVAHSIFVIYNMFRIFWPLVMKKK